MSEGDRARDRERGRQVFESMTEGFVELATGLKALSAQDAELVSLIRVQVEQAERLAMQNRALMDHSRKLQKQMEYLMNTVAAASRIPVAQGGGPQVEPAHPQFPSPWAVLSGLMNPPQQMMNPPQGGGGRPPPY